MKIPNGDRADLGAKVEDYSLNSIHCQGQHKARVFEAVLGITLANADVLRTALLHAAANSEDAIHNGNNGYGDLYGEIRRSELRFSLTTSKAMKRTYPNLFQDEIRKGVTILPRFKPCRKGTP